MEYTTGNTIKILLSNPCHLSSSTLNPLRNLHLLQLNQHATDNTSIRLAKVLGLSTTTVIASVPSPQLTNSHTRTEVDLAGDGCCSDVIPVVSVGGKLVGYGCFD